MNFKRSKSDWIVLLGFIVAVVCGAYLLVTFTETNEAAKRNPTPTYSHTEPKPIPANIPLTLGDESQLGVKFVSGNVQKIGKELKYSITVESTVIFKSDVAFWLEFYNGQDATGKQVKSIVVRGKTNPKQTITLDGSHYCTEAHEIVSCSARFVQ